MMRNVFAGASLYILVSTMGYGLRPEDWVDWVDAVLRAGAACYLVDWLAAKLDKAGQG